MGGGMADAFARILGQKLPEGLDPDAGPVLAKRKTKQMKEQEAEKSERKRMRTDRAAKKALKEVGLHTPDFRDIEQERMLRRVATRGVVALFNAIAKQQHALDAGDVEDAVGSARDVKQLAKDNFIQMLKGREKGAAEPAAATSSSSSSSSSSISSSLSSSSASPLPPSSDLDPLFRRRIGRW